MSFILDALKKSEAERARQAGPALLEMRIVRPRRRAGVWLVTLVLLLGINLAVLLWYVLRQPEAVGSPTTGVPVTTGPATVAPAPVTTTPPAAVVEPPDSVLPPAALPPPAAFVADPGAPIAGAGVTDDAISDNPADFEPAAASAARGSAPVQRSAAVRPNYNEITGRVPELRLDLHVYAPRPQDRYALINMHKMKEGDRLPEGPRVIEITRDGVVLEWQGSEFMLGRE